MTGTEPAQESKIVWVPRSVGVAQSQESAVAIEMRIYDRLIDRLGHCKPTGWSDLWLAMAGIAGGVAGSAGIGLLTLPDLTQSATKDVLHVLGVASAVIAALCVIAYFTQRQRRANEIDELTKDMQLHKGLTS